MSGTILCSFQEIVLHSFFSDTKTKVSSGFGILPVITVTPGQRLAIVENTRISAKQYGNSCRRGIRGSTVPRERRAGEPELLSLC
jgi:hypothetical protein